MGRKERKGSPYETPAPHGDEDIPKIDLPGMADVINDTPDEFPGRGQSGRMRSV